MFICGSPTEWSILISSLRYFQVASFFLFYICPMVFFFIFVKHPHILFPLLSSRLFLHPCRHQKSEKLHFPSSTFYILLNLYIYIFSDLPFTSATLCEGGANFRHFHRLKALSMNCIMDKFQYGGLRFRILHCLMNFLHFLPKRFCSNPVADFRVPRKIKYISVSFEL